MPEITNTNTQTKKPSNSFTGDLGFLNNSYNSRVTCVMPDGKQHTFRCAEAAFQAYKAAKLGNPDLVTGFERMNGYQASIAGQNIDIAMTDDLKEQWKAERDSVMNYVVMCKFMQSNALMDRLASLRNNNIEYQNYRDNHFGTTYDRKSDEYKGENKLGETLMSIRKYILRDNNLEKIKSLPPERKFAGNLPKVEVSSRNLLPNDEIFNPPSLAESELDYIFDHKLVALNNALISLKRDKDVIYSKEARAVYDQFIKNYGPIAPAGADKANLVSTPEARHKLEVAFRSAVNTATGNRVKLNVNANLGYRDKDNSQFDKDFEWVTKTNRFLPISPLNPRVRNNTSGLLAGEKTMYIDMRNLYMADMRKTPVYEFNPHLIQNDDGTIERKYVFSQKRTLGQAGEDTTVYIEKTGDRIGLNLFAPYVKQEDLDDLKRSFIGVETDKLSEKDMMKATNIIRFLNEHGMEYTLTAHPESGQVIANITNTDLSVRVIDTKDASHIGHVSDASAKKNIYCSLADTSDKNAQFDPGGWNQYELAPLCYALGYDMPMPDGTTRSIANGLTNGKNGPINNGYFGELGKGASGLSITNLDGSATRYKLTLQTFGNAQKPQGFPANRDDALIKLENSVNSARENLAEKLDVKGLEEQYETHKDEEGYIPVFSTDDDVKDVQKQYWMVLTGQAINLYKPAETNEIGQSFNNEEHEVYDKNVYTTPQAIIEQHAQDYIDRTIGNFKLKPQEADINYTEMGIKRPPREIESAHFNPAMVAKYETDVENLPTRREKMQRFIMLGDIKKDQLFGNEFDNNLIYDRATKFDPTTAVKLSEVAEASPFMKQVYDAVKETIVGTAGVRATNEDLANIMIDKQGVISYNTWRVMQQGTSGIKNRMKWSYSNEQDPVGAAIKDAKSDDPQRQQKASNLVSRVNGFIGQVYDFDPTFERDGLRVVRTNSQGFGEGVIIPQQEMWIGERKPGDPIDPGTRLHFLGYEDQILGAIRRTVRHDLYNTAFDHGPSKMTGTGSSLNSVYNHLSEEKLDPNFMDEWKRGGFDDKDCKDRIASMQGRFAFQRRYADAASVDAAFQSNRDRVNDPANDNFFDPTREIGTIVTQIDDNGNKKYLDAKGNAIFDKIATAPAKSQGKTLYLLSQAKAVSGNGDPSKSHFEGSSDSNDKTQLFQNFALRYSDYDSADRQQKAYNDLKDALCIDKSAGFAQVDLGGWTMDDAYVVSKAFADRNKVPNANWHEGMPEELKYRSLKVGDKITDTHGNKGVISMVVDPDPITTMEMAIANHDKWLVANGKPPLYKDADAIRKKAEAIVEHNHETLHNERIEKLFKANPSLSVVGAAYPGVSRSNAGTYQEASGFTRDLVMVDESGKETTTFKDGIGTMTILILPQTVDNKTHFYEKATELEGRRLGAQLSWVLSASGLDKSFHEFYGNNFNSYVELREYLNVCGYDMDERTRMFKGHIDQPGENRVHLNMPTGKGIPAEYLTKMVTQPDGSVKEVPEKFTTISRKMKKDFMTEISSTGGYMAVPFHLNTYSGADFQKDESGNFLVPVMSPSLRNGVELHDGTRRESEYTQDYGKIYEAVLKYENFNSLLKTGKQLNGEAPAKKYTHDGKYPLSDEEINERYRREMALAQRDAQSALNHITDQLMRKELNSNYKYNFFKEKIASCRIGQSATAVISPDPTLALNEMGMGFEAAKRLGYIPKCVKTLGQARKMKLVDSNGYLTPRDKDGNVIEPDGVLCWRDPALRPGAARYMKIKVRGDLTGVTINPAVDASFDGDFDGDTFALVHAKSNVANDELKEKLTHGNPKNLLDFTTGYMTDEDGHIPETLKDPNTGKEVLDSEGNTIPMKRYSLFLQHSLDVISGEAVNPEYKKQWDAFETKTNQLNALYDLYDKAAQNKDEKMLTKLADYAPDKREALNNALIEQGTRAVRGAESASWLNNKIPYGTSEEQVEAHLRAMAKYVNEGCKGSASKLENYAKAAGVNLKCSKDENGRIIIEDISFSKGVSWMSDDHSTGYTNEDYAEQEYSTGTKTGMTGRAGAITQKGASSFRGTQQEAAVLFMTYMVTQSVMQVKHDAAQARIKVEILNGPIKDLWNGYLVTRDSNGNWVTPEREITDSKGRIVATAKIRPTPEEWKKNFKEFFLAKDGAGVDSINEDFIDQMAEVMTRYDKNGNAYICGLQSKEMQSKNPDIPCEKEVPGIENKTSLDKLMFGMTSLKGLLSKADSPEKGVYLIQRRTIMYAPKEIIQNLASKVKEGLNSLIDPETQVGHVTDIKNSHKIAVFEKAKEKIEEKTEQTTRQVKTMPGFC